MYQFLNWISPAAATASFALFVFVPSLSGIDETKKQYALHSFLAAMPFLVAATFLIKKGLVTEDKGPKGRAFNCFFLLSSIGLLFLITGFSLLLAAIGNNLGGTFAVSFGISMIIYQYATSRKKP